jgi:hypothetical protein
MLSAADLVTPTYHGEPCAENAHAVTALQRSSEPYQRMYLHKKAVQSRGFFLYHWLCVPGHVYSAREMAFVSVRWHMQHLNCLQNARVVKYCHEGCSLCCAQAGVEKNLTCLLWTYSLLPC